MLPVIGIQAGHEQADQRLFHAARTTAVLAVRHFFHAIPFIIPALDERDDLTEAILDRVDGLLMPGGRAHVHPALYREDTRTPDQHDPPRDHTAMNLIRGAVERGMPVLGICRGMQEMNVAFGGSLFQNVTDVPGRMTHIPVENCSYDDGVLPAHDIVLMAGGLLDSLSETPRVRVNSWHTQAVDRLGRGMAVEAVAEDDTIEAIRKTDAKGFCVGVQWHPEVNPYDDPLAIPLFRAYKEALDKYLALKAGADDV